MRLNFVWTKRNKRLWKFIYLLAILLPLVFGPVKANDTLTISRPQRVDAIDNLCDYLSPWPPFPIANESQHLIDPSGKARGVNGKKLKAEIDELNKVIDEYNILVRSVKYYEDLDVDKAAPLAERITNHWDRITYLYKHFDEVDR